MAQIKPAPFFCRKSGWKGFFYSVIANIQRRPLRGEAEKKPSGGGTSGPERTGMNC